MSREERILEFMRREGPLLPNKVARFLGTDLIIAGAHLSELSSRKKVLVTSLKVGGGSPVYYLPEHEEKLQKYYEDLNGKDKVTFDLLKENKILRDKDLDALTRVSLRNIKDFAKPLQVNISGEREIFWKWYLIKNNDVPGLIKELLKPKEEAKPEPKVEEAKVEPVKDEVKPEPVKEPETVKEEKPKVEEKVEVKKEAPKDIPKPEVKKEEVKPVEKQVVLEKEEVKLKKEIKSDFYEKVKNYLDLKNIKILEADVPRKTEINLILKVPTAVGEILYYAKAKAKKKCSDKDVSSAFLEGQMKKLPVLFLYSGEITKKTDEMLQQDIFKNLILLHLD